LRFIVDELREADNDFARVGPIDNLLERLLGRCR
jgi:hypothetical protein